jgi:uroporphyrinogen-III synthase
MDQFRLCGYFCSAKLSEQGRMALPSMQALVTRPQEEAETLTAALAARGLGALVEPLMEIHFRSFEALDLAGVQAVLCTSANGVRALVRASSERNVPILAVGDATAARARAEGFSAVESAGGDVNDLIRLAATRLHPDGGGLLHVAGTAVAGNLAEALHARGFMVERRVLYEARPATALSAAAVGALRSGAIAFALFFSPRTAGVFARLADDAGVAASCARVTALAISPAADAALTGLPWFDRRVARRPNQPALLEELDHLLGERRRS